MGVARRRLLSWILSVALLGVLPPAGQTAPEAPAAEMQWLQTADGRRMGIALACDLRRTGEAWRLLGPEPGRPILQPLEALLPAAEGHASGFAVNGGYWNEHLFPVGVCAGEAGIYAALSHPSGLALYAGGGVIGPLRTETILQPRPREAGEAVAWPAAADPTAEATLPLIPEGTIPFNPAALPARTPYVIDFRTYTGPVQPRSRVRAVELEAATTAALRFNQPVELATRASRIIEKDAIFLPDERGLVLFVPLTDEADVDLPDRWRLEARLRAGDGEDAIAGRPVILATSAGPILMQGGRLNERLEADPARASRAERTLAGLDASGTRLWVVALMRGPAGEAGVTLHEAAEIVQQLGASEILNLDGGGSTSVWAAGAQLALRALLPLQRPVHHILFFDGVVGGE